MKILNTILATLKKVGTRIINSNNRSLGTVFGCLSGMIVGIIYVLDGTATLAIIGKPDTIGQSILAVLLATGTGGNLSSYIGATIDIMTGEKTIIDLFKGCFIKKIPENENSAENNVGSAPSSAAISVPEHRHFPVITSLENLAEERLAADPDSQPGIFFLKDKLEKDNKALRRKNRELKKQLEELASQNLEPQSEGQQIKSVNSSNK